MGVVLPSTCLSVCLSVRVWVSLSYLKQHVSELRRNFSAHVTCARGSVFLATFQPPTDRVSSELENVIIVLYFATLGSRRAVGLFCVCLLASGQ